MEIENLIRYSARAVGLNPSAIQGEARLRGRFQTQNVIRAIRVLFPLPGHSPLRVTQTPTAPLSPIAYDKPSARQDEARRRGLTHAVGLKPSAIQDEARLCGLCRQDFIRADPSYPCRSVFYSCFRGKARLCITRTPTVTLSTIGYRPSAIGYQLSAISYQLSAIKLSAIGYRLSPIGYRLSPIAYRLSRAKPACAG